MEREQELLAKIDIIRSRLPVSYRQAAEALSASGGDVVGALAELEEKVVKAGPQLNYETQPIADRAQSDGPKEVPRRGEADHRSYEWGTEHRNEEINGSENDWFFTGRTRGGEILAQLKEIVARGRETKIKIKQGERTVAEIPVAAGLIGLLAALASSELALLGALGSITAMAKKYTLEIERPGEGERVMESEVGMAERQIPAAKGYLTGSSYTGGRDNGQRTSAYGSGNAPYDAL